MTEIPNWFSSTDDRAEEKINEIIDYLYADKELRDQQYAAVANFTEKTKTLCDMNIYNQALTQHHQDLMSEVVERIEKEPAINGLVLKERVLEIIKVK